MWLVGQWVGRARALASRFRARFDTMIGEAELDDTQGRSVVKNERLLSQIQTWDILPEIPNGRGPDSGS
jgi:hypothetical protein